MCTCVYFTYETGVYFKFGSMDLSVFEFKRLFEPGMYKTK